MSEIDRLLAQLDDLERATIARTAAEHLIANASPWLIADLDTAIILAASEQTEELFGYLPGGMGGMTIHELLPERLRTAHQAHWESYSRNPQRRPMGTRDMTLLGLHRTGYEFAVEIGLSPAQLGRRRLVAATILPSSVQVEQS